MKSKDQILLENLYSGINNASNFQSFLSDESDRINVSIKNLLKEYVINALQNDSVTRELEKSGLLDDKYSAIQKLLSTISKNLNVEINSSIIDKIANELNQQ